SGHFSLWRKTPQLRPGRDTKFPPSGRTTQRANAVNMATILPIAEREARAASRHRHTYRLRQLMTLVALVVTTFTLWFPTLMGLPPITGAELFQFITWITYTLCLIIGAVFTVDCISEEKREGTLGLLLLTSLSGYDIVLGKFASAWLNCFYGLVAT